MYSKFHLISFGSKLEISGMEYHMKLWIRFIFQNNHIKTKEVPYKYVFKYLNNITYSGWILHHCMLY